MEKISQNAEDSFAISNLERELATCGLAVMEHVITPLDLANLRQNFLATNKKKVFSKVRAVIKAGDYIGGAWDTDIANRLFRVEFSEEQIDLAHVGM